jgi:hypothetical protein
MLLQHAWLAPLVKPDTIVEEDEDAEEEAPLPVVNSADSPVELKTATSDIVDQEVADWVAQAIVKRRNGTLGKSEKPALHAAPLDAVKTPSMPSEEMKANVRAMMEGRGDDASASPPSNDVLVISPKDSDAKDFAAVHVKEDGEKKTEETTTA